MILNLLINLYKNQLKKIVIKNNDNFLDVNNEYEIVKDDDNNMNDDIIPENENNGSMIVNEHEKNGSLNLIGDNEE